MTWVPGSSVPSWAAREYASAVALEDALEELATLANRWHARLAVRVSLVVGGSPR